METEAIGVYKASLSSTTVLGQPSCIAFSPNHPDLFVIGSYQLDASSGPSDDPNQAADENGGQVQSRSGTVQLFRLEKTRNITNIQTHDLTSAATQHTQDARPAGAVLDLRFSASPQYRDLFAVCTSTGLIMLFQLSVPQLLSSSSPKLELIHISINFTAETLLTSLAWDPAPSSTEETNLAVTTSDGRVAVLSLSLTQSSKPATEIQYIQTLHNESSWTAQWCESTQSGLRIIATGGDDATIHVITIPSAENPSKADIEPELEPEPQEALHTIDLLHKPQPSETHQYDDRTHEAGVTAILPLTIPNKPQILVTGSYDNHIRVLRPRINSRRWETMAELDLGGGVWKLDLLCCVDTTTQFKARWLILASCMHVGVRVLEVQCVAEEDWSIHIVACFTEHTSMCYASAAVISTNPTSDIQTWQVVSTSFYDRMVCVWEFNWIGIDRP